MKKFRYRLERVLHYRELIKEDKKRALGLARQELAEAQERLSRLQQEELLDRLQGREILTIEELQMNNAYMEWIRTAIGLQRELIARCEEKVAIALSEYIEAVKEAESLIKHKQKKLGEYLELIEKEEQKFLDELTTQRIGRAKHQASLEHGNKLETEFNEEIV